MKFLVAVLSTLFIPSVFGAEISAPEKTVKEFYSLEIHGPFGSDGRTLGHVRHLMSKELDALLTATDDYQDACRKVVPPDTKPWTLDGDPWYYHSADGANEIEGTLLLQHSDSAARVAAKLSYDPKFKWTDTVTLVKSGDSWLIANIRFEQGGSLIGSLRAYINYSCSGG